MLSLSNLFRFATYNLLLFTQLIRAQKSCTFRSHACFISVSFGLSFASCVIFIAQLSQLSMQYIELMKQLQPNTRKSEKEKKNHCVRSPQLCVSFNVSLTRSVYAFDVSLWCRATHYITRIFSLTHTILSKQKWYALFVEHPRCAYCTPHNK